MKQYKYLIFDADYTLVSYKQDEIKAFRKLYDEIGYPYDDTVLERSHRFSEEAWREAGLYDVHLEEIQQRYHELYLSHVKNLFEKEFSVTGFDYDPQTASDKLMEYVAADGHLMDGAKETLKTLSERGYIICVATNGMVKMQTGRLRLLKPYIYKLFASEALGVIKPNKRFYEIMLETLQTTAKDCLMIGDSLYSDIAGANGVGMDSCWFDTRKMEESDSIKPTFHISSLLELLTLLP